MSEGAGVAWVLAFGNGPNLRFVTPEGTDLSNTRVVTPDVNKAIKFHTKESVTTFIETTAFDPVSEPSPRALAVVTAGETVGGMCEEWTLVSTPNADKAAS